MCICLAATLLTHLGTVPSNKSYSVSHCLFLDRSYLFGRAAVSLPPPSLAPFCCRATTAFLCIRARWRLVKGEGCFPTAPDGRSRNCFFTVFSENHCWPCLVYFSSLAMWKTVGMYCHLGVASPVPSHCPSWVTPNFGGLLKSDKEILCFHRLS